MKKENKPWLTFKHGAVLFIAFAFAISLLAITGWIINLPLLASLSSEFIPMAPSTALIFIGLSGTGLIFIHSSAGAGRRLFVQASLLGMLLLVLILALRYFSGIGPDLEQILVPNPGLFGEIQTAHISPLTAMGFFLIIPAFLLLTSREPGQHIQSGSAALSFSVLILSIIITLGYLYGVPLFYGGTLIPVAVTTALSFLFFSLGLLLKAGPTCWPVRMFVGASLNARLMRAFIPASLAIVLFQGLMSTVSAVWIINPALRVAVAALVACSIFMLIIFLISKNLSSEIERGNQARKVAESSLNQSETRFRSLVETASDAIINIDRDGLIIFWNKAAETIFGYSAGEVIGKPLDIIMPEELQAAHQQGLQRVVLTGESHIIGKTVDIAGRRKDGRIFPLALSMATWKVGEEVFFTGIGRDITDSKRADEALRESEDRLRSLYENVPTGIYRTSPDGHILMANPALVKMLGYESFEELSKRNLAGEFYEPEYPRQKFQKRIEQDGEVRGIVSAWKCKDGSTIHVRESAHMVQNENNEPFYYEGTVEDITEQMRAEKALMKSESSLQAILRSTADGILAVGTENEVLYANEQFANIWRIPQEVMASKNDSILLQHVLNQLSDPQDFLKTIQELYKSQNESFDLLNFKDGRVFERLSRPLMEGEVALGRVWSFRDITERTRLEEEIRSLTLTDELTGLYNRRGFTLLAEQELKLAHREKRSLLLVYSDVDNLKTINDTLGHGYGDQALKEISAILKASLRESDILGRIGGDEFVALALDVSKENAGIISNRIESALEIHNQPRRESYQLSLSVGVAPYDPESSCTINELIAQADNLMYQQKQAKKGRKA